MNRSKVAGCLAGIAVLVLAGCGSGTEFVRMDPTLFPAKEKTAPVEVHQGSVLKPHVVIGIVTATRDMKAMSGSMSTYDEVLTMLKKKAREVGGDAIIEVQPIYSEDGSLNTKVELTAKVVHYLEKKSSVSTR